MTYELLPLVLTPARAEIISEIMRRTAAVETAFTGYGAPCEEDCISSAKTLPEMCETCKVRMQMVAETLGKRDSRAYEVWNEAEVVGIIYFTNVTTRDATGHYVFFDGRLRDKTGVISEAMEEMYARGLARLTIEIPATFSALARHAQKKLGFGGAFAFETPGGDSFKVEGVKRGAIEWRGEAVDLMVMGRLREG